MLSRQATPGRRDLSNDRNPAISQPKGQAAGGDGDRPIRLNFVMAPSYHSSTLLALLLNNHPDITCLGDTLPHRRVYKDQNCGCKRKVRDCPFWQEVSRRLDADRFAHCDFLIPAYPQVVTSYRVNPYLARVLTALSLVLGPGVWRLASQSSQEFLEAFLAFGQVVCELQGSQVFVNNQKSFTSLLALKSLLGSRAEIRIVHLLRDPRGYFLSERNQDARVTAAASGRRWLVYHRRVAWLQRYAAPGGYLPLRYEDLCDDQEASIAKLCTFLGVEPRPLCTPIVYPEKNHVLGNVRRFDFDGRILPSLGWMREVSEEDQERVLRASQPLSRELGYV